MYFSQFQRLEFWGTLSFRLQTVIFCALTWWKGMRDLSGASLRKALTPFVRICPHD